jgi:5'-nucleotidase
MTQSTKDTFVVAFSSSALFDARESDAIYRSKDEEAFIQHQIANEDQVLGAGAAMPVAKALLAARAVLQGGPKVKLLVLSRNNPAASIRVMKSAVAHQLPIERASFVGGAPLGPYLAAEKVDLFLSRTDEDVRDALKQGVAAARVIDLLKPAQPEENQLRVAFDFDSVLASDESERVYNEQGPKAYFENEANLLKVALKPGPFAPVLRWIAQLQRAVKATGANFSIRTAIITARNQAAMARVIHTMSEWGVRVDETHFLGADPKDAVLQAFGPHMFFDDQLKNVTGVVPSGHVPFGIKNEVKVAAPVPPCVDTPVELVASAAAALEQVTKLTKKDFEVQSRAIFRSYTPLATQSSVLDERFRVFVSKYADKTSEERAKIVAVLKKYDLSDLRTHDPILNRELGDIVMNKLEKAVEQALAPKQQDLNL